MSILDTEKMAPIGVYELVDFLPFEKTQENGNDGFRVGDYLQERFSLKDLKTRGKIYSDDLELCGNYWLVILEIRKYLCTEKSFTVWFYCLDWRKEKTFVPLKNVALHARAKA